jgi:hypothetical protein
VKLQIARDGEVIGEWTVTELYPLLRASEVFPTDFYWHDGMTEWRQLAELPCGKSVLATAAQKQMLRDQNILFPELITKYQVTELMDLRKVTDRQAQLMDMLGLPHSPEMSRQAASDLIGAELNGETIDGPATAHQMDLIRKLKLEHERGISRRKAAELLRFSHDARF